MNLTNLVNTQMVDSFFLKTSKSLTGQIDVCSGTNNPGLCDLAILQPILDNLRGGANIGTFQRLISYAASIFLVALVSVSVLSILWAAWLMISDNGDGVNSKKGVAKLGFALSGLVVALLSFALVTFIIRVLGRSR